jgi:2-dehydro-3-deoxygluconokinase
MVRRFEKEDETGAQSGALLTTYPGDVTMASRDEVEALARGGTARVQR